MDKPLKRILHTAVPSTLCPSKLEPRSIESKATTLPDLFPPREDNWTSIKDGIRQQRFPKFCLEKPSIRVAFEVQHVKKFKRRRIETGVLKGGLLGRSRRPRRMCGDSWRLCPAAAAVARHQFRPTKEVHPRMSLLFLSKEERMEAVRPNASLLSEGNRPLFKRPVLEERVVSVDEETANLGFLRKLGSKQWHGAMSENKIVRSLPGLKLLCKVTGRVCAKVRQSGLSHQDTGNILK